MLYIIEQILNCVLVFSHPSVPAFKHDVDFSLNDNYNVKVESKT